MSGVQDKVQQHYDEMAEVYDSRYDHRRGRAYYSHISRHVMSHLPRRGRLLDVGCGTGLFVYRYTSQGGSAVGLDISRGMITRARARNGSAVATVGSPEAAAIRDRRRKRP